MNHLPSSAGLTPVHPMQVAAVAAIIPDLSLDVYALRGTEASLQQLLAALAQQATKHAAPHCAQQALLALRHCAEHGPNSTQVRLAQGHA